ncbi:MAG: hypothetical protein IJY31_03580 [Muribaculaceae bacterium]|nr:hypothetical protein [Muribaculaceae bacterium]
MKNLLTIATLLFALTLNAQNDVTKFLGIPVDGSKAEMIQKLKAKGFTYDLYSDCLTGKFNNYDVMINVVTHNDKVWRIFIADAEKYDRDSIISRFNNLLSQFENDPNYTAAVDQEIFLMPDWDKQTSDAIFNSHGGHACFIQEDSLNVLNKVKPLLCHKYTEHQLSNPDIATCLDIKIEIIKYVQSAAKKLVNFKIKEIDGKYVLLLYYDNLHNYAETNNNDL